MELKDFISETLCELIGGVADAQKKIKSDQTTQKAVINPAVHKQTVSENHPGLLGMNLNQAGQVVISVDFNVAITVTDAENAEGKGKINVLSGLFGVSGGISSTSENKSISSVKFTIPISLPFG